MSRIRSVMNALNPFSANLSDVSTMVESGVSLATPWGTSFTGRGTDASGFPVRRLLDMQPEERAVTIKRSRFIRNRTGLGKAMIEGCGRYAIGEGVNRYSATGDAEFDSACDKFLDSLLEASEPDTCLDIGGVHNYYGFQQVAAPAMMTDGDLATLKIAPRTPSGALVGTPKLQMFATEQIADHEFSRGYAPALTDQSGWKEGIYRDEFGRAKTFRIIRSTLSHEDVSAADIIHTYDPNRIGLGRGIPWTHHGQDSAVTMMDLTALEKAAAYLNSFFGAVITTPGGEIPEGFEGEVFGKKFSKTSEKRNGDKVETDHTRKYANFMNGALIPVLKEGEKIEMVKNERPSLTFTGFMDWLVNDIAWGFGVPPSFVWAIAGRTGPETRMVLSQADWFFKHIMNRIVQRFCKPVCDFLIRWGLLTGRLNNGRPPRNGASPYLARWHGPRKITIDERYFFKTWLDRLDKGLGTEEEFYADLGLEASDVRRARVLEVADWMRLCEEHGVPYDLVRMGKPGQMMAAQIPGAPLAA